VDIGSGDHDPARRHAGEVGNWQEACAVLRLMLTSTATTPRTDREPPLVFGGCLLPRPRCSHGRSFIREGAHVWLTDIGTDPQLKRWRRKGLQAPFTRLDVPEEAGRVARRLASSAPFGTARLRRLNIVVPGSLSNTVTYV
jgi:hypothetical protein